VNIKPKKIMIEIQDNALHFLFPGILNEIENLVEIYHTNVLPVFLAEDRKRVYADLIRRKGALNSSDDYKKSVARWLCQLSRDDISKELKKHAMKTATANRPGSTNINFQRTLRIPDDGKTYDLPPGLGEFPLRHVEDYAHRVPKSWLERGGVMMPMYQAEALWLYFNDSYPFALKIAAGKMNAITGDGWQDGLNRSPQDYVVTPGQPWLDGFAVGDGVIRQFVAMPLGSGYSVEEQMTGKAEFGGIQIQAFPMKARHYFESVIRAKLPKRQADILFHLMPPWYSGIHCSPMREPPDMGLGVGGLMHQEIYEDPHESDVWDIDQTSRCFIHLCDAVMWRQITGENPPQKPFTAKTYTNAGLPWFTHYRSDLNVLKGSKKLAGIESVNNISQAKHGTGLDGNDSVGVLSLIDCSPV
jgi:hypothetical protein